MKLIIIKYVDGNLDEFVLEDSEALKFMTDTETLRTEFIPVSSDKIVNLSIVDSITVSDSV
jgi:hypothetical protein